jgi:hypothetical protein
MFKKIGGRAMPVKDFPEKIADPNWITDRELAKHPDYQGLKVLETNTAKFATFGSLFIWHEGEVYSEKIAWVKIPDHEEDTVYLISIALTMLYPRGGDFDQDDAVYADIFAIGQDETHRDIKPDAGGGYGGVSQLGKDDEDWGAFKGRGRDQMGVSTYIGPIKPQADAIVKLRVACQGDNLVGASYFILELGMK